MRIPVIAGNWKMHNTVAEALKLVRQLIPEVSGFNDREIVVAPAFTALYPVASELKGSNIKVSAQNVFWEEKGAYTGEVSAPMLKEAGCTHVIIGHSERRQYFSETDETVNKRIDTALKNTLTPVICIGETLEQRENNITFSVIESQIKGGYAGFEAFHAEKTIIAYEPVWAIGTGKTATPDQAQEVHAFIRNILLTMFGNDTAENMRILYGGSVKPDNVNELMRQTDIDGALVGGASLDPGSFSKIVGFKI